MKTILLSFAAALFALPPASGQDNTATIEGPIHFRAVLSADEQSAPTESPGIGCALFALDRNSLRLEWSITYGRLSSRATGVHVHGPQTPGGNAGVLFDLAADGLASPVAGSMVLNEAQLAYLLTGRTYVNLHTTRYADGELRGQIMRLRPALADSGCPPT